MRQKRPCQQAGFTLIELLIVIAVIGVLAAVVLVAINPLSYFARARDATRKIELKQIANALEAFITGSGYYPPFDVPPEIAPQGWACISNANVSRLVTSSGIKKLPSDPTRGTTCPCYLYALDLAQQKYSLFTQLEHYQDLDASSPKPTPDPSVIVGTMNATNTTFTVNTGTCTGTTFNYWITSTYSGFKSTGPPIAGGGIPIPPAPPTPPITPTSTPTPTPDITSSLVAYWKMDDPPWNGTANEVKDSAGNSHGTSVNATNTISGPKPAFNTSGSFNGTNAYVSASTPITLPSDITISSWIKTTSAGERPILSNRNGIGYVYYGIVSGKAFTYIVSANPPDIVGTITINDDTWHNIVFTRSGNTANVYVDGNLDKSITQTGYISTADAIRIGHDVANINEYFPGQIDDVRVYNRTLSASEVSALYNYTPPSFPSSGLVSYWKMDEASWNGTTNEVKDSAGTNNGTSTNANTATGKLNRAGSFNGIDEYVLIPDSVSFYITTGLTISAWIKPAAYPQDGGAPIMAKGTGAGGEVFGFDFPGGSNLRFYFWKAGNAYAWDVNGWLTSSRVNNWYLVTATYDAGSVKIYVDGVAQPTTVTGPASVPSTLDTNSHEISIGSRQLSTGPYDMNFNGLIDEEGIWNRALTQSEISTLYNGGIGITYP